MRNQFFVQGKWRESPSGGRFPTIDPSTEEIITDVPPGKAEDVDAAVHAADAARQGEWSRLTLSDRGRLILSVWPVLQGPHTSLGEPLAEPRLRGGKRLTQCRRPQTPAQAVGVTDHQWTIVELLSCPLPRAVG